MEGDRFLLLHTKIKYSSVWDPHNNFALFNSWIWMLMEAKECHRPEGHGRKIIVHGEEKILVPGQFTMTYAQMGGALNIDKSTAQRRTRKLVQIGNIATTRATRFTIVTINHWEDYQPEWVKGATTRATRAQRGRNAGATPTQHLREREKGRDGYKSKSSSNGFDRFWEAWPNKVGKLAAERAWKNKKPPIDLVLKAITWQQNTKSWKKDEGEFIPHPATWINGGRWEDQPKGREGGYRW